MFYLLVLHDRYKTAQRRCTKSLRLCKKAARVYFNRMIPTF